jgi:acyl-CoA thioesterase FadM
MPFFAMQYQILFHDTMAYGSHHHMTNFKFQNVARETILFETSVDGVRCFDEQAKDIVMLTREAYSLNLAPVWLGQKVGILLSYEDPSRSTVRLCFRVMDNTGQPVCCGYQTLIMMHKDTHELVPAPPFLAGFLDVGAERNLIEPLTNPSFAATAQTGGAGVKRVFTESIRQLGKAVASSPRKSAYPKIVDENLREYEFQDSL